MRKGDLLGLSAAVVAILIAPLAMRGQSINGTTTGSTVSGFGVDDMNTVTTINVTYQQVCYWLLYGMQAQFGPNSANPVRVTFAANGSNIGNLFTPIPASDFTISQYSPWVVNNWVTTDENGKVTGGMNYISSPAVVNGNNVTMARGVQGQDAGGNDIVISYNPRAGSNDPTKVNFIQSFVVNFNNTNPNFLSGTGGIDNVGSATPFYNTLGFAGSGTTYDGITLTASPTSAAWLADVPYVCESWIPTPQLTFPRGVGNNCSGGADDTLLSATEIFQTFVVSTQTICYDGTNYYLPTANNPCPATANGSQSWDVLYGGVQWGFTYTNTDIVPEPSSLLLIGTGLAGVLSKYRRSRHSQRLS